MDVLTGCVVVGFDGSEASAKAVDWAAAEAADTGAPLMVIIAYQPTSPWILSASDYVSHLSESEPGCWWSGRGVTAVSPGSSWAASATG